MKQEISYDGRGGPQTPTSPSTLSASRSANSYGSGQPLSADGIVERAASVLGREVPSGPVPLAGESIPQALASRSGAMEDLRLQAREWIDRLLAIAIQGAPAADLNGPVHSAVENVTTIASDAGRASLPVLAAVGSATPGDVIKLPMRMMNDSSTEAPLKFAASELLGASGGRIPASAISFWPENPIIRVGGPAVVEVKVAVPIDAAPGRYSGLIQVVGQPDARTLLSINVD